MDGRRIQYLDGLRGVAILLVIGFHAYARWPEIVPYRDTFAGFPLFKYGWLGVELFFLISGFVILMTLERCATAGEFLRRRWLRLFPAMAICTAIIFLSAGFFHERPAGAPSVLSALPGLLFVEPEWLMAVLHRSFPPLEGAFWSLYVEFKFYVIAAAVFFFVTRKHFPLVIFGLFLAAAVLAALPTAGPVAALIGMAKNLSLRYFGYFAAGSEIYLFVKTHERSRLRRGMLMALVAPFGVVGAPLPYLAAVMISLLFAAVVACRPLQVVAAARPLVLVGFASYPLYLLHENAMIASIVKLAASPIPPFLLPVLPIAAISTLAYAVAARGEPALRRLLGRSTLPAGKAA